MANRPCQRGQAAVELAFVLPVLFILTVALIDVGRAFFLYNTAANAAREAARFATVFGGSQHPEFDWGNAGANPYNGNWPNTYSPGSGHPASQYAGTRTIVGTVARYALGFDLDRLSVGVTARAGSPVVGSPIKVRLDYDFQPATSLLIGEAAISITASSEMVIQ